MYRSFKEYTKYQLFIIFRSEDQENEELNQHHGVHGRSLITLKIKDGTDYEPAGVAYNSCTVYGHQ